MVNLTFGVFGLPWTIQRAPKGHTQATKGKPTWYFAMGTWKRRLSDHSLMTRTTQLWSDGIATTSHIGSASDETGIARPNQAHPVNPAVVPRLDSTSVARGH